MQQNNLPTTLSKSVMTMQIITIAMLFGAINIAGIMVALKMTGEDPVLTTGLEPLVIVVIAVAIASAAAALIVPSVMMKGIEHDAAEAAKLRDDARHPTIDPAAELSAPEARMLSRYHVAHIVGSALFEGPAIMATIVFFLSSSVICLGTAVLMIMLLAIRMPTQTKVSVWMEQSIRHAA